MIQNIRQNETTITEAKGLTVSSDRKQKTTITPFEKVLDKVTKDTESGNGIIVKTAKQVQQESQATSGNAKLDEIFKRASEKYDVPYNFLIAVAKAESNFNVKATSKSGARGIMQLMPATAKSLGVTDAYDPEQNIMAGAKYLGAHLKTFNGDLDLAAAAYNAGGEAVKKYGGIPPYNETKNYVKTIQNYMAQGVTVPEKTVSSSTKSTKNSDSTTVDNAVPATEEDLNNSTVTIGTGDSAVTMTYGAYLRYLELGTTGVG